MASQAVQWVLIPPRSPLFGGFWEAGVKSVKRLRVRQMGNIRRNFEELTTSLKLKPFLTQGLIILLL